ncbi:hypothetical protein [Chitinivorax sp. B]|uniref:hypothetical protein n=1 Tax=Chitinivorax sp. B TaxID=2502235 RepID=UPI0010F78846|nr:hypothetical protein [Chitinivorax sp. B]
MRAITRARAALTHFVLSLTIFSVVVGICIYLWYPGPFFWIDGGWQGLRIAAPVDLVLGPLLTLIIFVPGKRGLKFDLVVIAMLQIAALIWGIYAIHHQRPAILVFADGEFNAIRQYQLDYKGTTEQAGHVIFSSTKQALGTKLVSIKAPQNPQQLQEMLKDAVGSGRSLYAFVRWYKAVDDNEWNRMLKKGTPVDHQAISVNTREQIKQIAIQADLKLSDIAIFPINGLYDRSLAIFKSSDNSYLGYVADEHEADTSK